MNSSWLAVGMAWAAIGCASAPTAQPVVSDPPSAVLEGEKLADLPGLRRLIRLSPDLVQGAAPQDAAGFRSLARLGIRTVISVDDDTPLLALAEAEGLGYRHIPIPYTGIPEAAQLELERVLASTPGPHFIHCHAGKHRCSAMVAIHQVRALGWDAERATAQLAARGCSRNYDGLFAAVVAAAEASRR